MIEYIKAKRVMDFYLKELENDMSNPQAVYAMQLATLKLNKYQANCMLNALTSYDIEVE